LNLKTCCGAVVTKEGGEKRRGSLKTWYQTYHAEKKKIEKPDGNEKAFVTPKKRGSCRMNDDIDEISEKTI